MTLLLDQVTFKDLTEVVKLLLDANADINYTEESTGDRPLGAAVKSGSRAPEVVKILLEANAEVNYAGAAGSTPLIDAAVWGHSDTLKLLLDAGADVDAKDKYGYTGLRMAARGNDWWIYDEARYLPVLKLLLEAKADVNSSAPLASAAYGGHSEAVKLLLEAGADVDCKDEEGKSPLSYAISRQDLEMVEILLAANASLDCVPEEEEEEVEGELPRAPWRHPVLSPKITELLERERLRRLKDQQRPN
jgi:ankyrin repeat protein